MQLHAGKLRGIPAASSPPHSSAGEAGSQHCPGDRKGHSAPQQHPRGARWEWTGRKDGRGLGGRAALSLRGGGLAVRGRGHRLTRLPALAFCVQDMFHIAVDGQAGLHHFSVRTRALLLSAFLFRLFFWFSRVLASCRVLNAAVSRLASRRRLRCVRAVRPSARRRQIPPPPRKMSGSKSGASRGGGDDDDDDDDDNDDDKGDSDAVLSGAPDALAASRALTVADWVAAIARHATASVEE